MDFVNLASCIPKINWIDPLGGWKYRFSVDLKSMNRNQPTFSRWDGKRHRNLELRRQMRLGLIPIWPGGQGYVAADGKPASHFVLK